MFAVSLPSEVSSKKKNPSIIDMANAAYSMTPSSSGVGAPTTTNQKLKTKRSSSNNNNSNNCWSSSSRSTSLSSSANLDERLDAARAMLGISPCSVTDGSVGSIMAGRGSAKVHNGNDNAKPQRHYGSDILVVSSSSSSSNQRSGDKRNEGSVTFTGTTTSPSTSSTGASSSSSARRPRSNSAGLDALAFLATQEQEAAEAATATTTATATTPTATATVPYSSVSLVAHPAVTSSSDDDSEIMPPPPPRTTVTRRRRSVSNPEGMDKWGIPLSMDYDGTSNHASSSSKSQTMRRLRLVLPVSILEEEIAEANAAVIAKEKSTASASALAASLLSHKNQNASRSGQLHGGGVSAQLPLVEEEDDDTDDDEHLDHDELLRRARSRLLEDLSQSNLTGEKGVLTLPHSLGKYKDVYNKNGRIGIYTPDERAAIIARFQSKRTRRVWNKKIRYNCRKNLADRRLRVKGRFVKRSTTAAVAKETSKALRDATAASERTDEIGGGPPSKASSSSTTTTTTTSSTVSSIPEDIEIGQDENDTEMPDVSDPDAGFCPTDDLPYRRVRRHTIT